MRIRCGHRVQGSPRYLVHLYLSSSHPGPGFPALRGPPVPVTQPPGSAGVASRGLFPAPAGRAARRDAAFCDGVTAGHPAGLVPTSGWIARCCAQTTPRAGRTARPATDHPASRSDHHQTTGHMPPREPAGQPDRPQTTTGAGQTTRPRATDHHGSRSDHGPQTTTGAHRTTRLGQTILGAI